MPQDVLIVDDVKSYLDNVGNEVRLNIGIEPFLTDDPSQALAILRDYQIKVLVTDQMMPSMSGTELVKKMKKELNLKIPCILLTGYADKVDIAEAVNLGFFRFIDKDRAHNELPEAIRLGIQTYNDEVLSKSGFPIDIPLYKQKDWVNIRPQLIMKVIRIASVVDPFIHESDWKTDQIAMRGISTKVDVSYTRKIDSSFEYATQSEIATRLPLNLSSLLPLLKLSLESKFTSSAKVSFEAEVTLEAKYSVDVKEIDDRPTQEGTILQSREYQSAPVFSKVNCIAEITCSYCQIPHRPSISIYLPTNTFALRQIERYDRGQPKIVYTGFIQGRSL